MNVTNLPTMSERIKDGTLPIQMDLSQATRVIDVLLCQETAHRTGCSMPTSIVTALARAEEAHKILDVVAISLLQADVTTSAFHQKSAKLAPPKSCN